VLDACRENAITFVAFSPVGRGALANGVGDPNALPDTDLRRKMPRFSDENWPKNKALIDAFVSIAGETGVTPAQLSLSWLLAQGDNIVVIPGTSNLAHLAENLERWDWELPRQVADQVNALINQQTVSGHRYPDTIRQTIDTEDFE
jgi:aryl-alcohol dehydrogenase-like predicted oxidoreductase